MMRFLFGYIKSMNLAENCILGLLALAIAAHAGGAASLVSQKSKALNKGFSSETQTNFMQDCSKNADEQICGCVFGKIQQRYDEKTFLKIDADLRKNKSHPDFDSFISVAVNECDAENSGISEEDATKFADSLFKVMPKKDFVLECSAAAKDFYGENMAKKVCGCAYDHAKADIPRFAQMVMESGYPGEDESWGSEYIIECAPEKFTPEMEKNIVDKLNQGGLPKSFGQCLVDALKKEYSVKAFISAATENKDAFKVMYAGLASRCLSKLADKHSNFNYNIDEILKELDQPKNVEAPRNRSNTSKEVYNENYNEAGSGGVGDGLVGLLGGGIATKARGSIKTPSERDIVLDARASRSAADIMRTVRQRTPGLRHIYNTFLNKKSGFWGKVTLKFTINSAGVVTSLHIVSSTTGYKEFDSEIASAVARWRFAKINGGNTTATIPFTFAE